MSRPLQKPKRIRPQLLVIPNHDEVVAAFKRALTANVGLIALELERAELNGGPALMLLAFTRDPKLTIQHVVGTEEVDPRRLIGAAEVLAQTASARARRDMGDPRGRQRSA